MTENDIMSLCKYFIAKNREELQCGLLKQECNCAGFGRLKCSWYYSWKTAKEDHDSMEHEK